MTVTSEAVVHNINTGGKWWVIQTITVHCGAYDSKAEAEKIAAALTGER